MGYTIHKAPTEQLPIRTIVDGIPHLGGVLSSTFPAFGPNYFSNNVAEMKKRYAHPKTGQEMSFREATPAESVSIAYFAFENPLVPEFKAVRSEVFGRRWLQSGRIAKTSDGVHINPIRSSDGSVILNDNSLKKSIDGMEKVNGIYLLENRVFVPYETFKQGEQTAEDFAQGGLGRGIEYARERAVKLERIASKEFHPNGVNVVGFDGVSKPIARVVYLGSCGGFLRVDGSWDGDVDGYAFGVPVLNSAEGTAPKK
jgi:hypothetical protein